MPDQVAYHNPYNVAELLVTARAAAALPAAGAWDATPTEFHCIGLDYVTFYITYTRGAAGGDMQFRVEYSPYSADSVGVQSWFRGSIYAGGLVASGADTLSNVQREDVEYGSTGAAAEPYIYGPIALHGTVARLRIPAAESGVVGNPGDCHIVALMY